MRRAIAVFRICCQRCDGIRSGRFQGTQINHLIWGALMSKADIVTFLTELLGAPGQCEAQH
jgi:hypothetical protein